MGSGTFILEVSRETGINRGTLDRLYYDTTQRIDLDVIETLCRYLECGIEDLFELDQATQNVKKH